VALLLLLPFAHLNFQRKEYKMPNSSKSESSKQTLPPQKQDKQPGHEEPMHPDPKFEGQNYRPADKLKGKVAIVTGGDSGIGRSVAVLFAREGADVVIAYLNEDKDAETTRQHVEKHGRRCLLIKGDTGQEDHCKSLVDGVISEFGRLDVIVNNAGEQHPQESIEDITEEQVVRTVRTNIFAHFFLVKAAMPHLKEGASIICTASVTAYRGSPTLLDYSSTKSAIVSFVRSLSGSLAKKKIRVNGVAPGPIWTPLIPSTFPPEKVEKFGSDVPMGRPGQPEEVAPAYVYLASQDSSYVTGQIIHVNGGEIVNG
jgi:NAD(P)-dependent dehydrogenase (short-subunit alcohol dehydrogenase family)